MTPRGPQDEANMGSRRAPRKRLGGLGLLWSSPGAVLGGLGRLLARSGRLLGRVPGRTWGSFGRPGELLLGRFGPLLKAPLRNRENHENR